MAGYRVRLSPAADRQRRRLHGRALVGIRGVILGLAEEPRPRGATKLVARRDLWRVKVRVDGVSWRIVYRIAEQERQVLITRVIRRDEGT